MDTTDGRLCVMHMVDSLAVGGAERVAVGLANSLPPDRYSVHLCTTRRGGPLEASLAPHVGYLALSRRYRVDVAALLRFSTYLRAHRVALLHAHSTAIFTAALASLLPPYPAVLWHDHFGGVVATRVRLPYAVAVRRAAGVLAVNQQLAAWARNGLGVRPERVWYLPNPVCPWELGSPAVASGPLPGRAGRRIVCVANLRPQKDHATLLEAFRLTRLNVPDAALLVVGAEPDPEYASHLKAISAGLGLDGAVCWMGPRADVGAILAGCDVAVLSSRSEGLPLALLEYGAAGLPVACTDVGQCAEVVDGGGAGILVPAGSPQALGDALVRLLTDREFAAELSGRLRARVTANYSLDAATERLDRIYHEVLA